MTALSLNLTPAKPLDASGIALEGLPPLEAGRSVPAAFAEALQKLTGERRDPAAGAAQETVAQASGDEPATLLEGAEEAPVDTVRAAEPGGRTIVEQLPETRPAAMPATDAAPAAATGKPLPVERIDLAAPQGAAARDNAPVEVANAVAAKPATEAATRAPVAEITPETGTPADRTAAPGQAVGTVPGTPVQPVARADAQSASESVPSDTDGDPAKPAERTSIAVATPAPTMVEATVPVVARFEVTGATPSVRQAASAGIAAIAMRTGPHGPAASGEKPTATRMSANPPLAPAAQVPVGIAPAVQSDGAAQARQDFAAGEQARRGEGEAMPSARQAAKDTSGGTSTAPAQASLRMEAAQTGLSLQLRAADRPMATPGPVAETGQSLAGSTLSTSASPIAAPAFGPVSANAALGVAAPAGQMPHFPELAAMVDRIAAARDSAGSTGTATATIALAHKELGNLSLTFEATGRTLDVEVAAQDGETQRALAAAIAADRPQLRAGEALAQQNTQSGAQSGQTNAQGTGAGSADQSGPANGGAGDSRQERRDRRGDGDRSHPGSDAHGHRQPKSDGGIYA